MEQGSEEQGRRSREERTGGDAIREDVLCLQLRIHLLHSLARSDTARVVGCECGAAQALAEDFVAGAGAEGVVELGKDAALDLLVSGN